MIYYVVKKNNKTLSKKFFFFQQKNTMLLLSYRYRMEVTWKKWYLLFLYTQEWKSWGRPLGVVNALRKTLFERGGKFRARQDFLPPHLTRGQTLKARAEKSHSHPLVWYHSVITCESEYRKWKAFFGIGPCCLPISFECKPCLTNQV